MKVKSIELNEAEVETLFGVLLTERNDLNTLIDRVKKSGQMDDFQELNDELNIVLGLMKKLA